MTENKRFTMDEDGNITDTVEDRTLYVENRYTACEYFTNLLNELNDKYNEIKEQYADDCNEVNSLTVKIAELEEELDYYKSKCASLEEGYLKLQKENGQLKNEIDTLQEQIAHFDIGDV